MADDPGEQRAGPDPSGAGEGSRSRFDLLAAGLAAQADTGADCSDKFAQLLEGAASRGDSARRRAIATWERDVAGIERYHAARLRSGARPLELKPLRRTPLTAAPDTPREQGTLW